jgi:hypothetical protein
VVGLPIRAAQRRKAEEKYLVVIVVALSVLAFGGGHLPRQVARMLGRRQFRRYERKRVGSTVSGGGNRGSDKQDGRPPSGRFGLRGMTYYNWKDFRN